jgi:2,3-bisphosphoglycerate-independent phosphoglycerate mutase
MKYVLFLGDGMADEPIEALGGRTPLMAAETPNLDRLMQGGHARLGTFRALPEPFPTSSDVANLSVLGHDLATGYCGRGPLEAASQGILLGTNQMAFRCSLVNVSDDGIVQDYSAGQITTPEAVELIEALQTALGSEKVRFAPGVAYRNLLILTGDEFSPDVNCEKPDDHQGDPYLDNLPKAKTPAGEATAALLRRLMVDSIELLKNHPVNRARVAAGQRPASRIWPWSGGRRPAVKRFREMYGKSGAIISAVDVIKGIGAVTDMDVIEVPGATGYIDTHYEGKACAAVRALQDHDFVYIHVEGIDEVSHEGDLEKKIRAIEDFDRRLIGTFLEEFSFSPVSEGMGLKNLSLAVLPDHPVPVAMRKHTRTPVPVLFVHPWAQGDTGLLYNELDAPKGSLGLLQGEGVMRTLFEKPTAG